MSLEEDVTRGGCRERRMSPAKDVARGGCHQKSISPEEDFTSGGCHYRGVRWWDSTFNNLYLRYTYVNKHVLFLIVSCCLLIISLACSQWCFDGARYIYLLNFIFDYLTFSYTLNNAIIPYFIYMYLYMDFFLSSWLVTLIPVLTLH